jgi:hypothetical protein
MNNSLPPRLGVDIGRVIIDGSSHPAGGDTAFFTGDEATMLATPEMSGAVETIARLVRLFAGNVWLVSKCGPKVQARTERWLAAHDFFGRTGMSRRNVRFCRQRADKRDHCIELGLTHFVDDHPEVHQAIRGAVIHQYYFGPQAHGVPSHGERPGPTSKARSAHPSRPTACAIPDDTIGFASPCRPPPQRRAPGVRYPWVTAPRSSGRIVLATSLRSLSS